MAQWINLNQNNRSSIFNIVMLSIFFVVRAYPLIASRSYGKQAGRQNVDGS